MARLTLVRITCNQINSFQLDEFSLTLGGPIELRAPIAEGPTARVWGPRQMQVGETIDFSTLPAGEQPQPTSIDFLNPTWVELWDTGEIFQAQFPEARTRDLKPWDVAATGDTLTYVGGEYQLTYAIDASAPEVIFAYSIAVVNLFITFLVITSEFLRNLVNIIVAPFTRLSSVRKD